MTSTPKRTWQCAAILLTVVGTAAGARAEKTEEPPPPTAETPAPVSAPAGPTGFGDGGQFVLSAERLFGYTFSHRTGFPNTNTFTLFSQPFGAATFAYASPRIGFDYFVTKAISAGGSVSFYRTTGNGDATGLQVAPRVGYGTKVGPWLDVWPRVGVTYAYSTGGGVSLHYLALTVEALAVIEVAQHLSITFGPTLDLGLSGGTSTGGSFKNTDVGVYFGLALPF